VSIRAALVIGVAQGLAVLPGVSRSGSTLAVALACGVAWRPAAAFSFVLSVPAILGATLLELRHIDQFRGTETTTIVVGVVVALVVGILALRGLLLILKIGRIYGFGYYCLVLGGVALAVG
jgi:undecaprenyl-diphosphatase